MHSVGILIALTGSRRTGVCPLADEGRHGTHFEFAHWAAGITALYYASSGRFTLPDQRTVGTDPLSEDRISVENPRTLAMA